MKKIIVLLLAALPILTFAQSGNGGQSAEDSYGKLVYMGYSSGNYVLQVTNKQSCTVSIEIKVLSLDTTISVAGGATITATLPGAAVSGTKITSKPLSQCPDSPSGNMGPLEVFSPQNLPIQFTSFTVTREAGDPSKVDVVFTYEFVGDQTTPDHFNIKVSRDADIKTFQTVSILWPTDAIPGKPYKIVIDLNKVKF